MRSKYFITLVFMLCSFTKSQAQTFYKWTEFGAAVGATQYFGDINDNYGFKHIRSNFGVLGRYNFNHYLSFRISANYTQVGYDDADNTNTYQKMRNLSFRSNILEATAQAEFNFFRFETGNLEHEWTPYLTAGIGAFYYNPYTFFQGDKYYLRPLGTEGQNLGGQYSDRVYGSTAVCFPIGAGVKWWLVPGVNMAVEVAHRLTTTDYLDDVSTTYIGSNKFAPDPSALNAAYFIQDPSLISSPNAPIGRVGKQRGANATKDQYLMVQFLVSIQLKTYKCPSNLSYWRTEY
jgi:hypothetical protein